MTPTRAELLATPLQDLHECYLLPHCAPPCHVIVQYPIKLLIRRTGVTREPLSTILGKLRCTACGRRPASVDITDSILDPQTYPQLAAKWKVEVWP